MMVVLITDPSLFFRRFFSTLTSNQSDLCRAIQLCLEPHRIFHREGFVEFATNCHYSRWSAKEHGCFSRLGERPPDWDSVRVVARKHLIRHLWGHVALEYVDGALLDGGWSDSYRLELEYLRRCYLCPKPPACQRVLSNSRYSSGSRWVVSVWWVALCGSYAGNFLGLQLGLARFLKETVEVPDFHFFSVLRGGCQEPLHKAKLSQPNETRVRAGASIWTESWEDRVVWGATAYLLGKTKAVEFQASPFWKAHLGWMDGTHQELPPCE